MDKEQLGKLIAELRKKHNLTQKELAEQLNVIPSTVCKWERGINSPDISCISKLSQTLEVSYEDLLNPEEALLRLTGSVDASEFVIEAPVKRRKTYCLPTSLWFAGGACAVLLLLMVGMGLYQHIYSRFTVVDTRYNYNGDFGVTYEMSVVCHEGYSLDALDAYTNQVRTEWYDNQYASDATAIDIALYYDRESARNWGATEDYIVLVKSPE